MEKSPPPVPTNNGRTCSSCRWLRRLASLQKSESVCVRYPPSLVGGLGPDGQGGTSLFSTTQHNCAISAPENWWCGEWSAREQ